MKPLEQSSRGAGFLWETRASRLLLTLALVGAMAVSACSESAEAGQTIEGTDVVVKMYDNRFEFTEIRIPVGGSVTWVGGGRNPHNSVADDGTWSTEDVFGSLDQYEGDEVRIVYNEPGEQVFYCTYHGNAEGVGMAGRIIVGDGG